MTGYSKDYATLDIAALGARVGVPASQGEELTGAAIAQKIADQDARALAERDLTQILEGGVVWVKDPQPGEIPVFKLKSPLWFQLSILYPPLITPRALHKAYARLPGKKADKPPLATFLADYRGTYLGRLSAARKPLAPEMVEMVGKEYDRVVAELDKEAAREHQEFLDAMKALSIESITRDTNMSALCKLHGQALRPHMRQIKAALRDPDVGGGNIIETLTPAQFLSLGP